MYDIYEHSVCVEERSPLVVCEWIDCLLEECCYHQLLGEPVEIVVWLHDRNQSEGMLSLQLGPVSRTGAVRQWAVWAPESGLVTSTTAKWCIPQRMTNLGAFYGAT